MSSEASEAPDVGTDALAEGPRPGWKFALASLISLAGLVCVIVLVAVTIASFT